MQIKLSHFRPGDTVRVTEAWLQEQDSDVQSVFADENGERKIGRVYAVYEGELYPILVVFGNEPDEWGFNDDDLEYAE